VPHCQHQQFLRAGSLGTWWQRSALLTGCILEHSDALHRDERPTGDHLVEDGQQAINVGLVIDHFNDDRKVSGQLNQAGRMDHAAGAKTGDTVHHGRSGEAFSAQTFQDGSR
jgi:hypothetical protein